MDKINPIQLLEQSLQILRRVKTEPIISNAPYSWDKDINELLAAMELIGEHQDDPIDYVLGSALTLLHTTIFMPFSQLLDKIIDKNLKLKNVIEDIEHFMMKVKYIRIFLPRVFITNKQCILSQDQLSPQWQLLNKFIHYIDLDTPENIKKKLDIFMLEIIVGSAYCMLGYQKYHNQISRLLYQNLGGLFYILQLEKCRKLNLSLINKNNVSYAQGIWGAMDKDVAAKLMLKSVMVGVNLNQKIYLPRLFAPITLDVIYDEIAQDKLYEFQQFNGLDMINENLHVSLKEPLQLKRNQASKVKVRLLSDRKDIWRKNIDIQGAIQQVMKISNSHYQISTNQTTPECKAELIKNVVLHLHGGGWIAMSSFTHQTYTRKWAKQLGPGCLIVSVDYRKTPEFPYPYALDDCWQVYLWMIYFSKFYLNVDPQKIVIAGDSAGGNMALGICLRCLRLGVPLPHGLLLSYPAMSLDLEIFTPSLLFSLNDITAPVGILQEVLKCYMKSERLRPDLDPYLSPGIANEKFLKALPSKLSIICGSQDTLRDECIKFLNRLIVANNHSQPDPYPAMHVYNGFSHGFLNYDFLLGISMVSKTVEHCGNILEDYFI